MHVEMGLEHKQTPFLFEPLLPRVDERKYGSDNVFVGDGCIL